MNCTSCRFVPPPMLCTLFPLWAKMVKSRYFPGCTVMVRLSVLFCGIQSDAHCNVAKSPAPSSPTVILVGPVDAVGVAGPADLVENRHAFVPVIAGNEALAVSRNRPASALT